MGRRPYVGNLAWIVTDQDLIDVFSEAGKVDSSQVVIDRATNRSRGFGFVEMATDEAADGALKKLNGRIMNADQVRGETDAVARRNHEAWLRRVHELRPGESDLRAALKRMELDHTVPIDTQLGWLGEAGFREVSCSYRNLIFAVCSGIK